MKYSRTIGIDLLGADSAPEVILNGVLAAAEKLPSYRFRLFGTLSKSFNHPQIELVSTSSFITMHDAPLPVVKEKKDASLVLGVQSLGNRKLDAFITCGNTGAFLVASALYIPRFIRHMRPALLCEFPSKSGKMAVVDVGGNLAFKAEWLVQFACMGASYIQCRYGKKQPRVALLNIGAESEKGTGEMKKAYKYLKEAFAKRAFGEKFDDFGADSIFEKSDILEGVGDFSKIESVSESANFSRNWSFARASKGADLPFIFVGNVEGKELFSRDIDVLVTSGFSGNIFLKTAEGVASFLVDWIVNEFQKSGVHGYESVIQGAAAKFSDTSYQGALLAGVDGVALKCHGKASSEAITAACLGADLLIEANVISSMGTFLRRLCVDGVRY